MPASIPPSPLRRFARDSALTMAQQGVTALCALATSIVIARHLGPARQGEYGVVFALAALTMTLANLGVGSATVYHVGRGTFSTAVAWRQNMLLASMLGAASAATLAAALWLGSAAWMPHVPLRLGLYASLMVPQLLVTHFLLSCLQGARRFAAFNIASIAAPSVTLAATWAAVVGLDAGVPGALLAYALGQAAAAGVACWCLAREGAAPWRPSAAYARAVTSYGLLAYLGNALSYLNYRVDVFLLNALMGQVAVGLYGIAVGVGERIWLLSFAASVILLPQVARDGDAQRLTPVVARHVLWLAGLGAASLAAIAPWAVPWVFGEAYRAAVPALWALLPGLVVFSLGRVLSNDIAGRGRPGLNAVLGVGTLALNILGNVLLIGPLGTVGAAAASSVAYCCDTIAKIWVYRRASGTRLGELLWPQADDWRRLRGIEGPS